MTHRHLQRGMTLIELIVVIAIIAVLIALLLPAVQRVRSAANRTHCINNLHQIGLALHNYHDVYTNFPTGVSYLNGASPFPFMSWHTRLLPFVEQGALWKLAEQAFARDKIFIHNPPHVGFATVMPLYGCPADPRTFNVGMVGGKVPVALTSYLGVSGSAQFLKNGIMYIDSQVCLTDIKDGTSNTLLVGERPPSADEFLGWWYAGVGQSEDGSGDMVLSVRERNISGLGPGCPIGPYLFGPGRVQNQCDAFHFWSLHSGGANFLFADGAVHFVPYSADPIMPALASRDGGESVDLSF